MKSSFKHGGVIKHTLVKKIVEMKTQYAYPVYKFENIKSVENTSLCFTIFDQLLLDILLTEIRGKTISYSTYKKKENDRKRNFTWKRNPIFRTKFS